MIALPWFAGARGPWWRADAHAAFIGSTDAHGPAELAAAVVEGIAFDVARCLELIAPERAELALAGAGAAQALWRQRARGGDRPPGACAARSTTPRPSARRLIVAAALGESLDVDAVPTRSSSASRPTPSLVEAYRPVRAASDAAAAALLG